MRITGYRRRGNVETLIVSYNGSPFDSVATGITSARVEAGGSHVEATVNGNEISFRPGEFRLPAGEYDAKLVLFSPVYPAGLVVAGPGKDSQPIRIVLFD